MTTAFRKFSKTDVMNLCYIIMVIAKPLSWLFWRSGFVLICLIALQLPSHASALVLPYTLTGTISGTGTTVYCLNGPDCTVSAEFTQEFGFIEYLDLGPGVNFFSHGDPSSGEFAWVILNSEGSLSGLYMTFFQTTCSPEHPVGCVYRVGSAPSFSVQEGAVPESSTWAQMLVGFGVVGFAMRRRKRARLIPTGAR